MGYQHDCFSHLEFDVDDDGAAIDVHCIAVKSAVETSEQEVAAMFSSMNQVGMLLKLAGSFSKQVYKLKHSEHTTGKLLLVNNVGIYTNDFKFKGDKSVKVCSAYCEFEFIALKSLVRYHIECMQKRFIGFYFIFKRNIQHCLPV